MGTAALVGFNLVMLVRALRRITQQDIPDIMAPAAETGVDDMTLRILLYCFAAVVAVGHLWFTVRALRLSGFIRPVLMLLLAVGVSVALGVLAGMALWALWDQWGLRIEYGFDVVLFTLLAAVGFGVTARLARRTRVLTVLAVVAPVVILGGVFSLVMLRSGGVLSG